MGFLKPVIIIFFAVFLFISPTNGFAEDAKNWKAGTDQGYLSDYLIRGTYATNDAYHGDVYLTLWDSFSLSATWTMPTLKSNPNKGKIFEVYYVIDYAFSKGDWSFDVGNITFNYPQTAAGLIKTTNELFLSVAYDTLLSPSLAIYYDYDAAEGMYLQFGVGHSIELSEYAALNLGAVAGYAINEGPDATKDGNGAKYWKYYDKNNGFTHADFTAAISFPLGKVTPLLKSATLRVSSTYTLRNTEMIIGNSIGARGIGRDEFTSAMNVNFTF